MAKREKRNRNRGSKGSNRKMADDFLTKNRNREGVIETSSGLQYQVIEEGSGNAPDENANVIIHQRCQLLNGKVIEDTFRENEPDEVPIDELIEGYREGILLMNKGGRSKFFVPPHLGWGEKGSGSKIPPNAVLIFDVRLINFW